MINIYYYMKKTINMNDYNNLDKFDSWHTLVGNTTNDEDAKTRIGSHEKELPLEEVDNSDDEDDETESTGLIKKSK